MTPPPRLRGLAIVGTDTGVGKTLVATAILRLAADLRVSLLPFKPAETGCPDLARPADALALRAAARRPDLPVEAICPHRFHPPVAPAAAASPPLRRPSLLSAARHLATLGGHALLMEGAGGVLSPYGRRLTVLDLAADLDLDLLLVSRNSLGTINHTALAIGEIRRRKLPLLGYVLVDTTPPPKTGDQRNAELIHSSTGIEPYAHLPYIRRPTTAAASRQLAQAASLQRYLRRLATPARSSAR